MDVMGVPGVPGTQTTEAVTESVMEAAGALGARQAGLICLLLVPAVVVPLLWLWPRAHVV